MSYKRLAESWRDLAARLLVAVRQNCDDATRTKIVAAMPRHLREPVAESLTGDPEEVARRAVLGEGGRSCSPAAGAGVGPS